MTSPYPGAPVLVPADATGTYPNLAGYVPMDLGRRVLVALADGAIFTAAYLVLNLGLVAAVGGSGTGLAFYLILTLAIAVAPFWALIARSARLAGVFMGARYVDVRTGRAAPGALFLKFLLQGVLSAVTFGIAPLVLSLATVQQPLQRNWFDRVTGLMLVDTRTGRSPDQQPSPAVAHPPTAALPTIAPVTFPGASPEPAPGVAAPWQPAPVLAPAPAGEPPASPYDFGASFPAADPGDRGGVGPISPVVDPQGIITSTPRSTASVERPAVAHEGSPVVAPDAPLVRDMVSVAADSGDAPDAEDDRTILSPDAGAGVGDAHAVLAGVRLSLQPPTVIGRNPQAPGSHPDAVPHVVSDLLASKTHLIVGRDDEGAWVVDLHSTNGVTVATTPGAAPARIEPGRRIRLAAGATVGFGDQTLDIR